jgi:hypothetical protein
MWTRALSVLAAGAAVLLSSGWALAQTCDADSDCLVGEVCLYPPCAVPCDPDDDTCDLSECTGICSADRWMVDDCATDDDCDNGWVCQVIGGWACADVACPDGSDCPEPQPCPEGNGEIRACVPPPPEPCESDADCEDGLVCVTYAYTACPPGVGRDCPPDSNCPDPEPVDCVDVTEGYCVPPYFAPCEEDDDCGPGFACVEGQMCSCSGGGAVGGAPSDGGGDDDGNSDDRDWADCSCEPTGQLYCELQDMPCDDDGDCPNGFACQALGRPSVPCWYDDETGETRCDDPIDDDDAGQCVPSDWLYWMGPGPRPDSGEDYDSTVGGAVGGEAEAQGRAPTLENPPDGEGGGVRPGGSSGGSAGGCQVAGGASGLPYALLFALVWLVGRRRR